MTSTFVVNTQICYSTGIPYDRSHTCRIYYKIFNIDELRDMNIVMKIAFNWSCACLVDLTCNVFISIIIFLFYPQTSEVIYHLFFILKPVFITCHVMCYLSCDIIIHLPMSFESMRF